MPSSSTIEGMATLTIVESTMMSETARLTVRSASQRFVSPTVIPSEPGMSEFF